MPISSSRDMSSPSRRRSSSGRMLKPLTFVALALAAGEDDDDIQILLQPNTKAAGFSLTSAVSSSAAGVINVKATLRLSPRPQAKKWKETSPKVKGQLKGPTKRVSTSAPPTKKAKGNTPKGMPAELTMEDFEACVQVGKLGADLFMKWNANAAKREACSLLEAQNLWLEGELLDKTDKLKYVRDVLLVEMRIERDWMKEERDTLLAKVNSLTSTEWQIENLKKSMFDANSAKKNTEEQRKVVEDQRKATEGKVFDVERRVIELDRENQSLENQLLEASSQKKGLEGRLELLEVTQDQAVSFGQEAAKQSS